jgi:hypothetical protein
LCGKVVSWVGEKEMLLMGKLKDDRIHKLRELLSFRDVNRISIRKLSSQ